MGLPPRANSNDLKLFRETFPEFQRDENEFRRFIDRRFPFYPFHPRDVHEAWFKENHLGEDAKDDDLTGEVYANFQCEIPGCRFSIKNGAIEKPQDEAGIHQLIIGTLGDLKEMDDVEMFSDSIIQELIASQYSFFKIFRRHLKDVTEAYYVDPYLGKFYLNSNQFPMGRNLIDRLSVEIPNLKFVTSDTNISTMTHQLDSNWKVKAFNSFPFHDRFIICKIKKTFFGVLIGKSGTGFQKSDDHAIIARLSQRDANKLYSILTSYNLI